MRGRSLIAGGCLLAWASCALAQSSPQPGGVTGAPLVTQLDHIITGGKPPTVTSCGTGAAVNGSTDVAGQIAATGATSCGVRFHRAYNSPPFCVATDNTTAAGLDITAISGAGFTVGGLTSGDYFSYHCIGQAGG